MVKRNKNRIIPVHMGSTNVYIVTNGRQAILIDAGVKKKEQKVIDALRNIQMSPEDVKLIVLTHSHYDHCGSLKELQEITRAKVLVHKAEAGCLEEGYCEFPKGTMLFSKILSVIGRAFAKKLGEYAPVVPDITISRRFDLHEYGIDGYILPTPGHTAGSLSVVIEEKNVIVGDTLFNIFKKSVLPPFANDLKALLKSWEALLALECEYFYPAHGRPLKRDKFRKTYAEMKR